MLNSTSGSECVDRGWLDEGTRGRGKAGGKAEDDDSPIAEMNKLHRLPNVSTRKNTKMAIDTTLTIPHIPEARSKKQEANSTCLCARSTRRTQ